ncbi:hypothetical protein HU200_027846 [Digitaria exilis]|uniref:DUF4220 domain-containing protein n=1 Tax=Digitaria exilis TaxID=1010633 RepID=A0A835ET67_9POAL|nr:hypothetical protein HU200_027846 [Digitaria exilis]
MGCVFTRPLWVHRPVTSYSGLDYKGPLSKMIFQLCLYCGYVLLMSFSTISGVLGKSAICILSVVTFIKGFHRSLALVLPSRTRESFGYSYEVESGCNDMVRNLPLKISAKDKTTIEDVCLGYSLSHLLQRRFLGLDTVFEMEEKREEFEDSVQEDGRVIDYKGKLKVIEIELAFLYEVFFTSNEYLHFYQAKGASIWALASFIGICLVGVATAIPGTMASRHYITSSTSPPEAGTVVVETTTADLIITLAILVSLALLQLVQFTRCWTSNWARVAFACNYARDLRYFGAYEQTKFWRWSMTLRAFVVTRMNWFDTYLWQDKLGQYALVDAIKRRGRGPRGRCCTQDKHLVVFFRFAMTVGV